MPSGVGGPDPGGRRIGDRIRLAYAGRDDPTLSPSALLLPIYRDACKLLRIPKEDRLQHIETHPHPEKLKAEMIRIYRLRQKL